MKSEDDLTFSSEVAETLGIECSVILSLYNKKPEFSDGKLFYENINDICLSNSQLSENSIVKKLN